MAAGRTSLTSLLKLAMEEFPNLLKGSNADDLKSFKRRVEQVWEHVTRDDASEVGRGGGRITTPPAPTPVIFDPAPESVNVVKAPPSPDPGSQAQRTIDSRTAALLREIAEFDKTSSAESYWNGKWGFILVCGVIIIIGGGAWWWWWFRRRRGGVHGHGVEDGPPSPPPAAALPEVDAPPLPPQEPSSDPTAVPLDPIAAPHQNASELPRQAPHEDLLHLNPNEGAVNLRWNKNSEWESANLAPDSDWKSTARPMMLQYTDATQGSYIEDKKTALIWHYEGADVNVGLSQTGALKGHLQGMLGDYPVYVKSGHKIVEVIPQGMSQGWFEQCEGLGIAAEHGYFIRWNKNSQWGSANLATDSDWKSTARPMMQQYTDATQGSYIEDKKTALVWHYEEADVNFGLSQSTALKDHLQGMLGDYPVYVKSGHKIVEVIPQGMSKGITVQKLIATMTARGTIPDFILCVGDDRSDEDMFKVITSTRSNSEVPDTAKIFACTIGFKPSSAMYFLESLDVRKILERQPTSDPMDLHGQVSKDSQE